MKNELAALLTLIITLPGLQGQAQNIESVNNQNTNKMKAKSVLIVVTSTGEIEQTGKKTGLWIEELASPYYLFTDQGIAVTIASPKGGKGPVDPKSTQPDFSTATVKRFFSDSAAQHLLDHTIKLSDINPDDYDAVYYPGGTGPVWDLPQNALSIHIIESFYQTGKPTALVCHAPAALKQVRDSNGELLIRGKKIAGYSNSEEAAGASKDMVPFSLEDMIKAEGGIYVKGEDWHSFVVSEGNLITGQNPGSSAAVAQTVIAALKSSQSLH
jgi:putative intracellular protease/amidase